MGLRACHLKMKRGLAVFSVEWIDIQGKCCKGEKLFPHRPVLSQIFTEQVPVVTIQRFEKIIDSSGRGGVFLKDRNPNSPELLSRPLGLK